MSSGVFEGRSRGCERGLALAVGSAHFRGKELAGGGEEALLGSCSCQTCPPGAHPALSPSQILPFHPHPPHCAAKGSWRVGSFVGSRWLMGLGQRGADEDATLELRPPGNRDDPSVSSARPGSRAQRWGETGLGRMGPSPWGRRIPAPQRSP